MEPKENKIESKTKQLLEEAYSLLEKFGFRTSNVSPEKRQEFSEEIRILLKEASLEIPNDYKLIIECISGNKEAWDTFVNRFSKLIYYSIRKTVTSYHQNLQQEDIEDIYNDVFASFITNNYKKLRQFEGKCTLATWIRTITMRRTIDFLRSQRNLISIDDVSDENRLLRDTLKDHKASAEKEMELAEDERLIKEATDSLPPSDKLFMKLYYERGLSPKEIAAMMHVSVSTIYSKKNRIREKIEKILIDR